MPESTQWLKYNPSDKRGRTFGGGTSIGVQPGDVIEVSDAIATKLLATGFFQSTTAPAPAPGRVTPQTEPS